jgi:hypothetical protein
MGPVRTCPLTPYAVSNIAQGMLFFDDGISAFRKPDHHA